jgi:hypothetical protein
MLRFVATYIMPFTTIGVYSVPPEMPVLAFFPTLYDHAGTSRETFRVLICVNGEKRVPARSRLYMGQSAAALVCVERT